MKMKSRSSGPVAVPISRPPTEPTPPTIADPPPPDPPPSLPIVFSTESLATIFWDPDVKRTNLRLEANPADPKDAQYIQQIKDKAPEIFKFYTIVKIKVEMRPESRIPNEVFTDGKWSNRHGTVINYYWQRQHIWLIVVHLELKKWIKYLVLSLVILSQVATPYMFGWIKEAEIAKTAMVFLGCEAYPNVFSFLNLLDLWLRPT
ncbi:hypothetical protein TWF481_010815 [Arthrobotrys musiformis]|uniref:Uncharacterized protein n=1 Tax=Arthrobotrys musiformis TaxID=47236 RepID=A0AAV9W7S3_9PEZI